MKERGWAEVRRVMVIFLGCLLLAVIINGLVLIRVDSFWQNLIFGIILLISVAIDKYRQKLSSTV